MDRLLKKPLNKAVGGPNSPSCWWHVFISLVVVGVYLWEWRYWSLFVLVTCVSLVVVGVYLWEWRYWSLCWWLVFISILVACISVMMVARCVSPSVMVTAVDLCVGGLFICGCLSPSVMMTGADCGPCWWPVFITIFMVYVYFCDDDWCWLQSVLLACVYLHLGGMCLFLWWWWVFISICDDDWCWLLSVLVDCIYLCVGGLCLSHVYYKFWLHVFYFCDGDRQLSMMVAGADLHLSVTLLCDDHILYNTVTSLQKREEKKREKTKTKASCALTSCTDFLFQLAGWWQV